MISSLTISVEERLDDLTAIELHGAIEAVAHVGVRVDAENGVDGGADVVGGIGGGGGGGGVLVRLADHLPRPHARAGEQAAEARRPVFAAGVLVDLRFA